MTDPKQTPRHGDLWLRKADFTIVAVLAVCDTHDEDDPSVSGFAYGPGRDTNYAVPISEFHRDHLFVAVDPECEVPPLSEDVEAAIERVKDVVLPFLMNGIADFDAEVEALRTLLAAARGEG